MLQEFERQVLDAGVVPGTQLLVAVSGGVDSVVLLHLLCGLRRRCGIVLTVAHLDHQLRSESASDADFVRALAARWDLPCHVERQDVAAFAEHAGLGHEAAGRQLRRDFLQRTAERVGASLIVLGHHRDDQIETFLQRLLRGSGTAGLAGMRILSGVWWRPLLNCYRQQILEYAHRQRLAWVEDASNADQAYLRNRLRHKVLPLLREINPGLNERWAELCCQLQDEDEFWQQQVAALMPLLVCDRHDGVRLSVERLLQQPRALRMRLLRTVLAQVRGDLQRLESVHLNAIEALLAGARSQAELDLPGCWVARRYRQLWLRREPPRPVPDYLLELPVPGVLELPCGRTLRASVQDEQGGESPNVAEFSLAGLEAPLRVRNWRAGDVFVPQGMSGHKRLKRFFSDQKIDLEERHRIPLVLAADTVLWLAGQRRSRHAVAGENAGQILRLELL